MAGGGIIGYEPVDGQPNALNFKTSDGRSMLAFGPEAMQLKQQIDSTPRPMFAGPGAAEIGPPAAYSVPEFGQPQPAPPPAPMGPPPPPQDSAPPGPASPQAPGPAGAPSPTGDLGAYLTAPVRVAGSPGVSREQLVAKAGQGVATPKSASEGVEGGFTPDADYLDNMGQLSVDERLQRQDAADYESQRAQQEAAMYRDQFAKNAAKEAAAAKQAELTNAGMLKQQLALQTAREQFASSKVDPNRIFSGENGGIKTIGSIIASALGAYAATISKTPNFAQNILDNAVERDIRAQEAEIRVRGEGANNALQDLIRKTGDAETAKSALRVIQMDQAQRQLSAFAADSKSDNIKRAAAAWDTQHQQALNEKVEDYRQKSLGKVTRQVQQEVLYPKAATASYERAPTDKEVGTRLGNAKVVQDIGSSRAGVANTDADTNLKNANANKVAAEATQGPKDEAFTKSATALANLKGQTAALAQKYGYQIKDGQIVPGKGASFPSRFNPSGSAALESELTALGVTFSAIANNDAELGEAAKAKLTPQAHETDATIQGKLQAMLNYANTKEGALKSTANPNVVRGIENNQRGRGAAIRAQAEGGQGGGGVVTEE